MKTRLFLALAGLAISFALPAFAQQINTPDPQLRQELVALLKKFDESYNNNDADAVAANFTEDAILVTPYGPIFGRQAIKQWYADLFKTVHLSNLLNTVDPDCPHLIGTGGKETWATGKWSATLQGHAGGSAAPKGYWSVIAVREGDERKIRMLCLNTTPAPAATGATTPSAMATPEQEEDEEEATPSPTASPSGQ